MPLRLKSFFTSLYTHIHSSLFICVRVYVYVYSITPEFGPWLSISPLLARWFFLHIIAVIVSTTLYHSSSVRKVFSWWQNAEKRGNTFYLAFTQIQYNLPNSLPSKNQILIILSVSKKKISQKIYQKIFKKISSKKQKISKLNKF